MEFIFSAVTIRSPLKPCKLTEFQFRRIPHVLVFSTIFSNFLISIQWWNNKLIGQNPTNVSRTFHRVMFVKTKQLCVAVFVILLVIANVAVCSADTSTRTGGNSGSQTTRQKITQRVQSMWSRIRERLSGWVVFFLKFDSLK